MRASNVSVATRPASPAAPAATVGRNRDEQSADVFVAFGISGDLAKVMTFRSLYRLERRQLLDCGIVGVAVEDWTDDRLREHARAVNEATGERIDDVFDRFAGTGARLYGRRTRLERGTE
jgi:glucose-6-phosphate 1-dehydrogenase